MPSKCAAAICAVVVVVVAGVCAGASVPSEPHASRVKRSLTTICVEIQPSRPQEEPYFMCKGAELPGYSQSSWPLTSLGLHSALEQLTAPTLVDSNLPGPSDGASAQQLAPTSMYNGKSQPFHPHTDSSYYRGIDNNNDYNYNYRPGPGTPTDKYESGFYAAPQQSHPQQQQQQFFSPAKPAPQATYETPQTTPSATDTKTYSGNESGSGHQPLQPSPSPVAPTTQPVADTATQAPAVVYAAPTVYSRPEPQLQPQPYPPQVPAAYNSGALPSASPASPASPAASQQPSAHTVYGDQQRSQQRKQQQQQSNSGDGSADGSYAPSSFAAALPGAEAEESFAPQAVHGGRREIPPAIPSESAQRTAAAPAAIGNAAGTATTTSSATPAIAAGYVPPAVAGAAAAAAHLKAAAHNFDSTERYPSAGGGYSETLPATSSAAAARNGEQRFRALIDENVQGMPDWDFTPEEFDLYRPMSSGAHFPPQARAFTSAAGAEPVQSYGPQPDYAEQLWPQLRTIPAEHMDDPVMRQFYASLHDPPAPAPQFTAAHSPPLLGLARSYSASQLPSASYPAEAGGARFVCTPPVAAHSSYPPTPTPPAPTQHSAASNYMDSAQLPPVLADKQCNSCQSREYGFTPIIIALPCYGQSPAPPPTPPAPVDYGDRFGRPYTYTEFPAPESMATYGEVGMANPMLGAYPSAQAMPAGAGGLVGAPFGRLGLFGGPHLFPPFGLIPPLFGGGLLGSTQSRPQLYAMRSNNGGQNLNDIASPQPLLPYQHPTAHIIPERARGENTAALTTGFTNYPTSQITTVATTTTRPHSIATTENVSQTDSNESSESVEELKDHEKSEEAASASQEQQASTPTARPTTAKVSADMEPALGDTLVTPELPANLGEEATKTFKTMMQAARALTNIHKEEKDTTSYADNSNSNSNQDRPTKDAHAKSSSTSNPNADW